MNTNIREPYSASDCRNVVKFITQHRQYCKTKVKNYVILTRQK